MKRSDLERYLGKTVEVTLFDGSIVKGELHKTGEEKFKFDRNLYTPQKLYFCLPQSELFRCSHVKKLKEGYRE